MANRRQAIIWTDADPIQWRLYAALGGDEMSLDIFLFTTDAFLSYSNTSIQEVQI